MKHTKKSLYLAILSGLSALTLPSGLAFADQPYSDPVIYSLKDDAALTSAEAKDAAAVVQRQLQLADGTTLAYTATTGHMVTEGGQKASIFYTAYTANNQDSNKRPVTFLFNGGLGTNQAYSPAAILHITGWGPVRLSPENKGTAEAPLFELQPSADSLLETSDLVFIDPPGSGYSQAVAPAMNKDFYSVSADANVVRDFILKYLKTHSREISPKFVYGESGGGPRAIHIANKLNDEGIYLNGVILNSPAQGRYAACGWQGITDTGVDSSAVYSCAGEFATIAALSHYYGLVGKDRDRESYISEVVNFLRNTYLPQEVNAIKTGGVLPDATINKLSEYIGFSRDELGTFPYVDATRTQTLLKKYISSLGLETSCGTGNPPLPDYCPANNGYDMRRVQDQPYGNDWNLNSLFSQTETYFKTSLGYESRVRYNCKTDDCMKTSRNARDYNPIVSPSNPWIQGVYHDSIPVLEQAMKNNQGLRVLVLTGYYDNLTRFGSAIMAFSEPELDQQRIQIKKLPGGHMMFQDKVARTQMRGVLSDFYQVQSIEIKNDRVVAAWNYPLSKDEFLSRVGASSSAGPVFIDMPDDKYQNLYRSPGEYKVPLKAGNSTITVTLVILKDSIPPAR